MTHGSPVTGPRRWDILYGFILWSKGSAPSFTGGRVQTWCDLVGCVIQNYWANEWVVIINAIS